MRDFQVALNSGDKTCDRFFVLGIRGGGPSATLFSLRLKSYLGRDRANPIPAREETV